MSTMPSGSEKPKAPGCEIVPNGASLPIWFAALTIVVIGGSLVWQLIR